MWYLFALAIAVLTPLQTLLSTQQLALVSLSDADYFLFLNQTGCFIAPAKGKSANPCTFLPNTKIYSLDSNGLQLAVFLTATSLLLYDFSKSSLKTYFLLQFPNSLHFLKLSSDRVYLAYASKLVTFVFQGQSYSTIALQYCYTCRITTKVWDGTVVSLQRIVFLGCTCSFSLPFVISPTNTSTQIIGKYIYISNRSQINLLVIDIISGFVYSLPTPFAQPIAMSDRPLIFQGAQNYLLADSSSLYTYNRLYFTQTTFQSYKTAMSALTYIKLILPSSRGIYFVNILGAGFVLQSQCDESTFVKANGVCKYEKVKCDPEYNLPDCKFRMCPESSCVYDPHSFGNPICQYCSGHGTCRQGVCICDEGFTGSGCQTINLPCNSGKVSYNSKISQCECDQQRLIVGISCQVYTCMNGCLDGVCKNGMCTCGSSTTGADCSIAIINLWS